VAEDLVRVTHPFHPLSGRQLVCVGRRYNRYGMRLLLRVDGEGVCSVPPQWTDRAGPDPEVVLGRGRGVLRVADLLKLAELVARLIEVRNDAHKRKDNLAACVNRTMPRTNRRRRKL
jgi:Family of unknown function (DUF5372)